MRDSEYGTVADGIATHSGHVLHYWVGHKSGEYMRCSCGAVKNTKTGAITYG